MIELDIVRGRVLSVATPSIKNKYGRPKERRKTRDSMEVSVIW